MMVFLGQIPPLNLIMGLGELVDSYEARITSLGQSWWRLISPDKTPPYIGTSKKIWATLPELPKTLKKKRFTILSIKDTWRNFSVGRYRSLLATYRHPTTSQLWIKKLFVLTNMSKRNSLFIGDQSSKEEKLLLGTLHPRIHVPYGEPDFHSGKFANHLHPQRL